MINRAEVIQLARDYAQRLQPYAVHLGVLASAIFIGWGVGFAKISAGAPEVNANDSWPLPRWAPYQPSSSWRELAQLEMWGPDANLRNMEPEEETVTADWYFIGIVQEGEVRQVVIELPDNGGLKRLSVGDKLPNGEEIVTIGENELTFADNESTTTLRLFSADAS